MNGEHVLEDAPLVRGTGVVESAGRKAKSPRVFVEVLRKRRRLLEFGIVQISYNEECRCRILP